MTKWFCRDVVLALMAVGLLGGTLCEKTTTKTEVKDRMMGGTEVKETQVTEQGDKTQVKETKTKLKADGTLEKRETTVKGDDIK